MAFTLAKCLNLHFMKILSLLYFIDLNYQCRQSPNDNSLWSLFLLNIDILVEFCDNQSENPNSSQKKDKQQILSPWTLSDTNESGTRMNILFWLIGYTHNCICLENVSSTHAVPSHDQLRSWALCVRFLPVKIKTMKCSKLWLWEAALFVCCKRVP